MSIIAAAATSRTWTGMICLAEDEERKQPPHGSYLLFVRRAEKACRIDLCGVFDGERRSGFSGWGGGDDQNAYQNAERSEDGPRAEGFAAEEVSDEDGDDGVDVGVGSDLGGRFVMEEPDVGGKANERSEDDEVNQGEPGMG